MSRLSTLLQMLAAEPTDAFLLFAIAKEYESTGDDLQALDFYTQCRTHNPEYVGLFYHLAKLYERKGDIDTAVAVYDAGMGVAKAQNNRHAHNEMAIARSEWVDDDDF
jgi:tetratricopeptide (TPR) repeat protein